MRKADNLPPSCAVVTNYGNLNFLEPFGPVQAVTGLLYLYMESGVYHVLPFALVYIEVRIKFFCIREFWLRYVVKLTLTATQSENIE